MAKWQSCRASSILMFGRILLEVKQACRCFYVDLFGVYTVYCRHSEGGAKFVHYLSIQIVEVCDTRQCLPAPHCGRTAIVIRHYRYRDNL